MGLKEVENAFFKKIREQERPPFFPFENPDDYIIGKVLYTYSTDFGEKTGELVTIHVIEAVLPEKYSEQLFSLPRNKMIQSFFEREKVEIGDYVMVLYKGESKTKKGLPLKIFTVAKMDAEEYERLMNVSGKEKTETREPAVQETKKELVKEEQVKPETKAISEIAKEKVKPPQELGKAVELVKELMSFYEELNKVQLAESLKALGITAPIDDILKFCDFVSIENDVIKLRR